MLCVYSASCLCCTTPWPACYNTWLLIKLTPKGVVFSLLFFLSFFFCYTTRKSLELRRHLCNVADAKWLACSFFKHYSGALAHPDVALPNPADAVFLTQAALDKLDWTQQTFRGGAWKQSVQAALKQISIEDYYKMSNQRFPQALSSVGIYAAGMYRALVHMAWFLQHITGSGDRVPCYAVLF